MAFTDRIPNVKALPVAASHFHGVQLFQDRLLQLALAHRARLSALLCIRTNSFALHQLGQKHLQVLVLRDPVHLCSLLDLRWFLADQD